MAIDWTQDADGVVVLTMDAPGAGANTITDAFRGALDQALDRIDAERDGITGVVIASAKKTFLAGMDLDVLVEQVMPSDPADVMALATGLKARLRRLETLGLPVVAAINGAALGGGLELALACHHRIAADVPGNRIGLPEVQLGVLPGAGGVARTVRLLGIEPALTAVLLSGARLKPVAAQEIGLVDDVVGGIDELVPAAKAWIAAHPDAHTQPWDVRGYRIPGGEPSEPAFAQNLPAFPANLHKRLGTDRMPAPRAILAAAVEGAQVDFDTAQLIESRYFVSLVESPVARNMVQAFFFDVQAVQSAGSQPQDLARVVGDEFTTRVRAAQLIEAIRMLADGIDPAVIEQAATQAGYAVPPLQAADELGLATLREIVDETSADGVLGTMLDLGRPGAQGGAGFYDDLDGQRARLWDGLREQWNTVREPEVPFGDLQDRLLFSQVIAAQQALDDGVVDSDAAANVGSLFALGFPAWTGGVRQFVAGYPGGEEAFRRRAEALAGRYGERFPLPASLGAVQRA